MEESAVEFPCIVKVDLSWSGRGTMLANNKNELSAIVKEIREDYGWKETILYQEMIQGIEEVPGFQFYLHKSGEIYWIGSMSGEFTGYKWTSGMIDWDRQDEYKNLAWDNFTIPIAMYLHKQGYYGFVMYELLRTNHGMYLCDLNARVSGDTAHFLVAPLMAQLGYKQSWVTVNKKLNAPPKIIVENADEINEAANNGRVIVLSAASDGTDGNGCFCDLSIYAKTNEDLKVLYDKVTQY
ncbi:hypothetical protein QZH41_001953 [Actinostola sp. cb2023]|nr:hypothetical protein QZH41_001953 [Actinostola sp. cb2023]